MRYGGRLLQLAESGCEVGSTLEHRRVRDVHLDEPCVHAIVPKQLEGHVIFVSCCGRGPKVAHRVAKQVVTRALWEPLIKTSRSLDGVADDRNRVGDPPCGQIQLSETQQDMAARELRAAALEPAQSPDEQFLRALELTTAHQQQSELVLDGSQRDQVALLSVQNECPLHEHDGAVALAAAVVGDTKAVIDASEAPKMADGPGGCESTLVVTNGVVVWMVAHMDGAEVFEDACLEQRRGLGQAATPVERPFCRGGRSAVLQEIETTGFPISAFGRQHRVRI